MGMKSSTDPTMISALRSIAPGSDKEGKSTGQFENVLRQPWIARLLRVNTWYNARLGNQFAAAVTYFSILSIVPILMLAFSMVGMVLTLVFPDLLIRLSDLIHSWVTGSDLADQVVSVIDDALTGWAALGIIGTTTTLWAGAAWVANLKSAVRAQTRSVFDAAEQKKMIVVETLGNIGILFGFLIGLGLTTALATVATSLSGVLSSLLGLERIPGAAFALTWVPGLITLILSWVLFVWLFHVLPEAPPDRRAVRSGAAFGALGFVILQYLTGYLVGVFSRNATAAIFGSLITGMLFLNLFAKLLLYCAAWIATSSEPVTAVVESVGVQPGMLTADEALARGVLVRPNAAESAMKTGLGAGYLTGAATGVGLGALLAYLAGKAAARRRVT